MSDIKIVAHDDGKFRQFLAAIIVNLTSLSYGTLCGWPSPIIPQLRGENSPVGELPMSEEGASWIGGLLCVGGLISASFSGSLADKIGRKRFGYASSVPYFVSFLMTIFATNHETLYVSRFIGGLGSAMTVFLVPCFISEIASEHVRGALGSLLVFSINIGILIAFVGGAYMPYTIFGIFLVIFPTLFLVAFFFIPESPVYLVKQNRLVEANKSLMFFRGDNKLLAGNELSRLQSQIHTAGISPRKTGFLDLLKDRATRRGLLISLGLLGGQQLGGIFAMISYAETIFKLAGSSLSADIAAVIIGTIQIFGSYLSTILIERAGRRPLVLISSAGMCACHSVVGLFCYLQKIGYDVSIVSSLPVVALSIYMISYCLGMGPVPFIVASEVFHVDIASIANTVCFVFLWGVSFTVIRLFNPTMNLIGIDGCFFLLGTFCACTFVFAFYLLPETKGRRREDIVEELTGSVKSKSSIDLKTCANCKNTKNNDLTATEQV